MKERSIVVKNSYFNIVYDWALKATGEIKEENGKDRFVLNEPAAKLIAVFQYHYENRYANRKLVELVERAMNKHRKHLREMGDWMPYSLEYLQELLLMTHGQKQIIQGRDKLLELGFISMDVPEDIQRFYSRSYSWFKLNIDVIEKWLEDNWYDKKSTVYREDEIEVRKAVEEVTGKETKPKTEKKSSKKDPETLTKQIGWLGKFYAHIHGKNASFIFDDDRKKAVRTILKNLIETIGELQAVGMCAQAIIGNVLSDFHQARHPKNMLGQKREDDTMAQVYDEIAAHIFKNGKQIEKMVGYAEDAGVTQEIALKEFTEFVKGNPSRYSKLTKKAQASGQNEPESAKPVDSGIAKIYRAFASEIHSFFSINLTNAQILEECDNNETLQRLGKGLTDANLLFETLLDIKKSFGNGVVLQKTQTQMREFAQTFCEDQSLNQ